MTPYSIHVSGRLMGVGPRTPGSLRLQGQSALRNIADLMFHPHVGIFVNPNVPFPIHNHRLQCSRYDILSTIGEL